MMQPHVLKPRKSYLDKFLMAHPERQAALARQKEEADKANDTLNLSRPDAGGESVNPTVQNREEPVRPVVNQRNPSFDPVVKKFLNESLKCAINELGKDSSSHLAINPNPKVNPLVVVKRKDSVKQIVQSTLEESDHELNDFYSMDVKDCCDKDTEKKVVKVKKRSKESVPRKVKFEEDIKEEEQLKPKQPDRKMEIAVPVLETTIIKPVTKMDSADSINSNQKDSADSFKSDKKDSGDTINSNKKNSADSVSSKKKNSGDSINSKKKDSGDSMSSNKKDSVESIGSKRSNTNVFTRMIKEYSNALDLNDYERNCLGFAGESEQKNEEVKVKVNSNKKSVNFCPPIESKQDHKQKPKPKPYPHDLQEKVRNKEKETVQDQYDESSTWGDLVDKLFLKSWFDTTSSNNSEDYYDYNDQRMGKINENHNEKLIRAGDKLRSSNMKVNTDRDPISLFKEGILDLLDQICDGDHIEGNNNCYKCQYKEIFKSFTQNYLGELDSIWNCGELSPQQVAEKMNETMEMWIYQLAEQNLSLAGAYNTSLEASEKLKRVLIQSRNSMRTLQKDRDKDKACIDALTYELSLRDKTIKKLKYELEMELEKMRGMEDSLQDNQADVQSLTELIVRLRDKGVWDIHGLPLGDETFKKIFSEDYYLHGAKVIGHKEFSSKKREWRNEIDQLKSEADTLRAIIAAKDKEIQRCSSKSTEPTSARLKFDSRV